MMKTNITHNTAIREKHYLNMVCMLLSSLLHVFNFNLYLVLIFYWGYHLFYLVMCNKEMSKNVRRGVVMCSRVLNPKETKITLALTLLEQLVIGQ